MFGVPYFAQAMFAQPNPAGGTVTQYPVPWLFHAFTDAVTGFYRTTIAKLRS